MRMRGRRVEVCFTDAEYDALKKKADKAGLTVGGFVQSAVAGKEVKEAPPADVPYLLREMKRIGYNLNQTLKRANSLGMTDMPQLRKDMDELRLAIRLVTDSYLGGS